VLHKQPQPAIEVHSTTYAQILKIDIDSGVVEG
jgi:hypothetical protein